jgi:hypothetical protein
VDVPHDALVRDAAPGRDPHGLGLGLHGLLPLSGKSDQAGSLIDL